MSHVLGKVAYKPVGLVLGAAAGVLSGLVFRAVWNRASGQDEVPHATDEERGWGEILAAAALQGAIFSVVRAAVDRAGAAGVRRATGYWPD
jgi:hypothetical protein